MGKVLTRMPLRRQARSPVGCSKLTAHFIKFAKMKMKAYKTYKSKSKVIRPLAAVHREGFRKIQNFFQLHHPILQLTVRYC